MTGTDTQVTTRIGVGLPNAIPGRPPGQTGDWALAAEELGFASLGTIERLVYDVLDPLVCLGAAAAVTGRIELLTCVLNVGWRNNAVLFAKQLATVDLLSGGRLTAGLGIGGWPQDFTASGTPEKGHGRIVDDALDTMRRVWAGEVTGLAGPAPLPGVRRPRLLIGGLSTAAYARAVRSGSGWVAPISGRDMLRDGVAAARERWSAAGRPGRPQILVPRYVCLGPGAPAVAAEYVAHYYGPMSDAILADAILTEEQLAAELTALTAAGADDVLLFPCSAGLDQLERLADALSRLGLLRAPALAG